MSHEAFANVIEDCQSIAWHPLGGRHERKSKLYIGEHNLSIVGGNWEGIIGEVEHMSIAYLEA